MQAKKQNLLQIVAAILSVMLLFTACSSKATNAADKIELGQKYLTELKYTEAVAAFTEVIPFSHSTILICAFSSAASRITCSSALA